MYLALPQMPVVELTFMYHLMSGFICILLHFLCLIVSCVIFVVSVVWRVGNLHIGCVFLL